MSSQRPAAGAPSRRRFLRGLGGVAVALPFLEYFAPKRASAGTGPLRYVTAFAGTSIGFSGGDSVVPGAEGPLTGALPIGLKPLSDAGVVDVVSCVSNLLIPWGSPVPAGGRMIRWHSSTPNVLSTGMRSAGDDDESFNGITSDQLAAETLASPDQVAAGRAVLPYRVQAAYYRGDNGTDGLRGTFSALAGGQAVPPLSSPRVAFQSLFGQFVPPDPGDALAAQRLLERRKSVIDLVRSDTEALTKKVGKADQIRLDKHLTLLRSLETRLEQIQPPTTSACMKPMDPGDDPPIGDAVDNGTQGNGGPYDSNAAYSNEEQRATVLTDLIHMAFVCDLSRVASLMYTFSQCFMNMNPTDQMPSDLHEISHYSMGGGTAGQDALARGVAWHVRHWARLIQLLRDSEDADGTSILDQTALVLAFEGGWGDDPEQGLSGEAHSSENMIMLIGGRAGGLHTQPGRHIRTNQRHPVEVVNTAIKAVGVNQTMGEVPGTFDELFA